MKKLIFITLSLFLISNHTYAQTPLFQQLTSRSRGVTNLAEPQKYLDSFLGQDKSGPYILSWRNIFYVPGYPVSVYVDNLLLRTNEYTLDVSNGVISFNRMIKRTEIVRVEYNYFPETATKNANPTLTAPLTIKLASNSFSGLTFTTLNNQNLTTAPTMVLGYSFNKGGLTSNYYVNPNGKSVASDNALKLGYSLGTNNNFSANYEKSDKSFSPYAKSFGAIDSGERSNIGGKYLISKNTNVSYNNSSFRSLNSVVNNNNTSAQFNYSGRAKQPSLNLSYNDSESVDAKNIKTISNIQTANFNSQIGEGSLNIKSTKNDSSTNGARIVNNQDVLSFRSKQFQAGRVQDFKIDPKAGTISSVSDTLNYSTKILGGSASFAGNQTDSLVNNKEIQNDQFNYNLNFKGNSRGFKGFSINRNENNTTVSNSQSNVTNDKLAIGFKDLNYSTNTIVTNIGALERKDVIDNSLTYSLPTRKNSPVFSFSSIDSIKRNDKGVLVGASNDVAVFKHKLSGLLFNVKFGQTTNYNPNGNVETIDNSTGNLAFKVGPGSLITENINNQIITGNLKPINQESFRFNYSIVPAKNMPGVELERTDSNSTQGANLTNVVSDKLKISSKIGSTLVNATTSASATDNNSKVSEIKNNNVSINTPILGSSTNLSVNLNNNSNLMPNGQESKNGLGLNLSPSKNLTLSSEQSDSKLVSSSGNVVNFASNNKFGLSYNLTGALFQTSLNTIETNSSKSEIVDYRTVFGNDKTFLKVDSFVRMRDSTSKDILVNRDTTQTSVSLNASKNFKVAGTYALNPYDPAKPDQIIPYEKTTLGMQMNMGNLSLNGSFSSLEHSFGATSDLIAKNGGYNASAESGIKLGYKAGSSTFYSEFKDQFFYGTNFKGLSTYTIGFTQQKGDRFNFTINGTAIQNKNNSGSVQDFRAEAKLGVKF